MFGIEKRENNEIQTLGQGLFEMHVGNNGLSMNVGTGGTDISLGNIVKSFNGLRAVGTNAQIMSYAKEHGIPADVALRGLYSFGDKEGQNLLSGLLSGRDKLQIGKLDGADAKTTLGNGGRIVTVAGLTGGMDDAVLLQHEAHRDGVVTDDNKLETRSAASSHMRMALDILNDGYSLNNANSNEASLYAAFKNGGISQDQLNSYIDSTYDSSADYWRLTKSGKLEYDGDGYLKDEDGNYIDTTGKKLTASDFGKLSKVEQEKMVVGQADPFAGFVEILGLEKQAGYAKKLFEQSGYSTESSGGNSYDLVDLFDRIQTDLLITDRPKYDYPLDETKRLFERPEYRDELKTLSDQDPARYAKNNYALNPLLKTFGNLSLLGPDYFNTTDVDGNSTALGDSFANARDFVSDSINFYQIRQRYVNDQKTPPPVSGIPDSLMQNISRSASHFGTIYIPPEYNLNANQKTEFYDRLENATGQKDSTKGYPDWGQLQRGIDPDYGYVSDTTWCVNIPELANRLFNPGSTLLYGPSGQPKNQTGTAMVQNMIAQQYEIVDGFMAQALANKGYLIVAGSQGNPGHVAVVAPSELNSYTERWGPMTIQNGQRNGKMYAIQGFGATEFKTTSYFVIRNDVDQAKYLTNKYLGTPLTSAQKAYSSYYYNQYIRR